MRKLFTGLLLVLISFSLFACGASATPTPVAKATPAGPVISRASTSASAEGKLVPARFATLAFQVSGLVAQVPVKVGATVESGAVLARLDSKSLELQLAQAEANLASAQSALDRLTKFDANELATLKSDIDKTKALLDRAQAAYDRIGGDSNSFAAMTQERANLQLAWLDNDKAQALYRSKINPPDTLVQQTKAALDAARAARDLAADQLNRAKIVAPFGGTIASVDLKIGEQVGAGTPVLRLADYSEWQVETVDLTELNIVGVKEGNKATMTFDAIPDLQMTGTVQSVKGFGDTRQGDIVYTIVVKLDKPDPRLRWNMTTKVTIEK